MAVVHREYGAEWPVLDAAEGRGGGGRRRRKKEGRRKEGRKKEEEGAVQQAAQRGREGGKERTDPPRGRQPIYAKICARPERRPALAKYAIASRSTCSSEKCVTRILAAGATIARAPTAAS